MVSIFFFFSPFLFFIPSITTMSWKGIGSKMYAQTSGLAALSVSMTLVTQRRGNNGLLAKCQLQVWFRDEKKGAFFFFYEKEKYLKFNQKYLFMAFLSFFLESYEDLFRNSFFCH